MTRGLVGLYPSRGFVMGDGTGGKRMEVVRLSAGNPASMMESCTRPWGARISYSVTQLDGLFMGLSLLLGCTASGMLTCYPRIKVIDDKYVQPSL